MPQMPLTAANIGIIDQHKLDQATTTIWIESVNKPCTKQRSRFTMLDRDASDAMHKALACSQQGVPIVKNSNPT
jgi:hypothetical protein